MRSITATELNQALLRGEDYMIIDIREPYEHAACSIDAIHIPMGEICEKSAELPTDRSIVIMCRSGKRAEAVANMLASDHGMNNIYLLEGGITAWRDEVDQTLDLD
jgi:rhodanese-related sulfurtransferase